MSYVSFCVDSYDTSDVESCDPGESGNNNEQNTFDGNNDTFNLASESQLSMSPSTPNTIAAADVLDEILETTSVNSSRTYFDLNDNTIVQG